jgi:hypothetical protein
MTDLIILKLANEEIIRCTTLDEASVKATYDPEGEVPASVEITPEGGGPMVTLVWDKSSRSWVAET